MFTTEEHLTADLLRTETELKWTRQQNDILQEQVHQCRAQIDTLTKQLTCAHMAVQVHRNSRQVSSTLTQAHETLKREHIALQQQYAHVLHECNTLLSTVNTMANLARRHFRP